MKLTKEYPIRFGGMMRCCIQTLEEDETEAKDGDIRKCLYCSYSSELKDGAWQIILSQE